MKTKSKRPLMTGVTVRIEQSTFDKLDKYCKDNHKLKTRVVKEAIEDYFAKGEK